MNPLLPKSENSLSGEEFPCPDKARWKWLESAAKFVGEDPSVRFGSQLARIASDMVIVCDEELDIHFHNRAFLKGGGYREGTFVRHSLFDFFPRTDRKAARAAFESLRGGYTGGMRINASFLTRRGTREFDIRAVRSRCKDASFLYYLVGRDDTARVHEMRALKADLAKASALKVDLFGDLPIAMWRTDRRLKIEAVHGGLWKDMGIGDGILRGLCLADGIAPRLPSLLHDIDFCYAMAGRSLKQHVSVGSDHFEVSIEPVLNEKGFVVGTLGVIRRSKHCDESEGVLELNAGNSRIISFEDEKSGYLKPGVDRPLRPTPTPMRPPELTGFVGRSGDEAETIALSR